MDGDDVFADLMEYLEFLILGFVGAQGPNLNDNFISQFIGGTFDPSKCATEPTSCGISCLTAPELCPANFCTTYPTNTACL